MNHIVDIKISLIIVWCWLRINADPGYFNIKDLGNEVGTISIHPRKGYQFQHHKVIWVKLLALGVSSAQSTTSDKKEKKFYMKSLRISSSSSLTHTASLRIQSWSRKAHPSRTSTEANVFVMVSKKSELTSNIRIPSHYILVKSWRR